MKTILLTLIFMLSLSLVSCTSNQEQYVDLMISIDQMVETKDNEAISEEEKNELLNSYIEETSSNYTYEIDKDLTYDHASAIEKIAFGFTFYGDDQEFTKEEVTTSLTYFESVVNDFKHINDEISYDFTIEYDEFEVINLEYTNEMLFKGLEMTIERSDEIEDLYDEYEDLIITLGNNEFLDSVDIWINGVDFEIQLSLKLNLGYYGMALSQIDMDSSLTFDDIKDMIEQSMKETPLISIEHY